MEILGIEMHNWCFFFKELIVIEVINSHTVFLALLNMECVCNVVQVWGCKLKNLSNSGFNAVSWVEHQFDISVAPLLSKIWLKWSSNHSLALDGTIYELFKNIGFYSHLIGFFFKILLKYNI